jgi:hypothetical protein
VVSPFTVQNFEAPFSDVSNMCRCIIDSLYQFSYFFWFGNAIDTISPFQRNLTINNGHDFYLNQLGQACSYSRVQRLSIRNKEDREKVISEILSGQVHFQCTLFISCMTFDKCSYFMHYQKTI